MNYKHASLFLILFFPFSLFAGTLTHTDSIAPILFWTTLLLILGIIGRYIAIRLKQPGVLGELIIGIIIGNCCYFFGMDLAFLLREGQSINAITAKLLGGTPLIEAVHSAVSNVSDADKIIDILQQRNGNIYLMVAFVVDTFSRYGIIFLLFMVGVETSFSELKSTGRASLQVACLGVLAPMVLGYLAISYFFPEYSINSAMFIAATLAATSIGITAEVLKDLKILCTKEAKIILGAAMIDDILGLIVLSIVSSIVITGKINYSSIGFTITSTIIFFLSVIYIGPWLLKRLAGIFHYFDPWEEKLFISFIFLMALSWMATQLNLSSIIGAFAAGMAIHDGFFVRSGGSDGRNSLKINEFFAPLQAILVPLFFILIGMQVKIETFLHLEVIILSFALIIVAIVGKLISGLGALHKTDKLLVGIGMLPRGEVGLIFASIGKTIGVISDQLFASVILMIIITTLVAPVWLKIRSARKTI